jgi:anaerobic selenocysteine-containing dehydrogenase
VEALGALGDRDYRLLRRAARLGSTAFALAFAWKAKRDQRVARHASVVLYRTLGTRLPAGMEAAASLWGICQMYVRRHPEAARRAGFAGSPPKAANALFDAILRAPSGVVFAVSEYDDSWRAIRLPDGRINLHIPELVAELAQLESGGPPKDLSYPFILSAGERRSDTSNTAIRDPGWHRDGPFGTLRINPQDATRLGCTGGDWVRMTTRRGSAKAPIEITSEMQPGHVSLPNGHGIDYHATDGALTRSGVAVNEITDIADRDPIAGTPWHKHVPVRIARAASESSG